jgi:UDP-glucose 4-epimerase
MGNQARVTDRVLITGGFGYLGGRIAVELGRDPRFALRLSSRDLRETPSWSPEAETVATDLSKPAMVSDAVRGVQAVVHLAAMNENQCATDPAEAVRVNTLGTRSVLQAAIEHGVERFIYISTARVYGTPLEGHITEKTLTRPDHPYASTHYAAEEFVLAAHDSGQISGTVARVSNGFGAPTRGDVDRWTLLVNDLCMQAVRNRVLALQSSGLGVRDFVTLHDLGRAVRHFLDMAPTDHGDGLFNLGGDCTMTVAAMAQRVVSCCTDTLGYTPELRRPPPGAEEKSGDLRYDIGKLKATGFVIEGNIDNEINRTLELCSAMEQGEPR